MSRTAVERVLARAAELHNATDGGDSTDVVSETQLLEIAREVGLSPASVRQAMAEERTRIAVDPGSETGIVARWVGPGVVSTTRTVRGTPAEVIATLDSWMQREECLQVQRRFPDRVVWEARTDWFTMLRRNLRFSGRSYLLGSAATVSATVIAVDETRSLVRLDADITPVRRTQTRFGIVAGSSGIVLGGTFMTLGAVAGAMIPAVAAAALIPMGFGGIGSYAIVRRYRTLTARVLLALEQALDRIEFAEPRRPSSLLDVVAAMGRR